MNRRIKKLLVLPAAAGMAALGWTAAANSLPPDPQTGRFTLVPSATSINVNCPAPDAPGGTVTDLSFSVTPGGDPVPPAGSVFPAAADLVTTYMVSGAPFEPIFFPVDSSGTYSAGTTVPCPAVLGTSTAVAFTAQAGLIFPEQFCIPDAECFGPGFFSVSETPATASVTLNFLEVPSGSS